MTAPVPSSWPPAPPPPGPRRESPRSRRLAADCQQLYTAFSGHPFIRVEAVGSQPPEHYRIIYDVPGLWLDPVTNHLVQRGQHVVELFLPLEYPREKPYCTTPNPIWHPNFGNYICIADYWSPGQALVDVVVQIGEMILFKIYNTSSPLNALAARWAMQNGASIPLAEIELLPREPEIRLH
jgi:ubiquitin-protein ligase